MARIGPDTVLSPATVTAARLLAADLGIDQRWFEAEDGVATVTVSTVLARAHGEASERIAEVLSQLRLPDGGHATVGGIAHDGDLTEI